MDFPFFKKKSTPLLGIDISSSAVKIIELSAHQQHYKIESYGMASIPSHAIVENDIKDISAVSEAIKLAYNHSHSNIKTVAAAVPSSAIITKVLAIDASITELEMNEYIPLEAKRYIPYPLAEVALDFTVLNINEKETSKNDVLIVAARNEQVESRTNAIQAAGLIPNIMDVQSYAIERVCYLIADQFPQNEKNQPVAVVDIGSVFTTITVLHDLHTIFSQDEILGGRQLTGAIQNNYGVTFEQAELMKKQNQFSDNNMKEMIASFCESVMLFIHRSLQLFFAASHFTAIEHILLAGGGAMVPGISEFIQERLGIPCTIANLFKNMSFSTKINTAAITTDSTSLMICCGLALRSFESP